MKNFIIKLAWFTTIYALVFTVICQTKIFQSIPIIMSIYLLGLGLSLFIVIISLYEQEHKTSKKIENYYDDDPKKGSSE